MTIRIGAILSLALCLLASAALAGARPLISGSYVSSASVPRVYWTPSTFADLVTRINTGASFSNGRFASLATQITADLATALDYSKTYSGCRLDAYLYGFSYELSPDPDAGLAQTDYGTANPPRGAAPYAARLALYAALIQAGATPPGGAPSAASAATKAKDTLLAWANNGFKLNGGALPTQSVQFCTNSYTFDDFFAANAELQIGRGLGYWVQAIEMLDAGGYLNSSERATLDAFTSGMLTFEINASNYSINSSFNQPTTFATNQCDHYSNHRAQGLQAELAMARRLNNGEQFYALLNKTGYVSLGQPNFFSVINYFDQAVYGSPDQSKNCYLTAPGLTPSAAEASSTKAFNLPVAFAGEVVDRYRRASYVQPIGYSSGVIERLYDMGIIAQNAGFDFFGYTGLKGKTLKSTLDFYSCFITADGFAILTSASSACSNYAQYVGAQFSGLQQPYLRGAAAYPSDTLITAHEAAARAAVIADDAVLPQRSHDALFWGHWRN